jgi:hypothetical protein
LRPDCLPNPKHENRNPKQIRIFEITTTKIEDRLSHYASMSLSHSPLVFIVYSDIGFGRSALNVKRNAYSVERDCRARLKRARNDGGRD